MGVNGPKPLPALGNILMLYLKPFPIVELELLDKYGKIYGAFNGNLPVLTLSDPTFIKLILIKDFHNFTNRRKFNTKHEILDSNVLYSRDEKWKRMRSISSPVFSNIKLKKVYPLLMECVNDFLVVLRDYTQKGEEIDLKELSGNLSMDVIARCAFATKINAYRDRNNPFITSAKNIFHPTVFKIGASFLAPESLLKFLNITSIFDEKSNEFFFNISRELMNKRRINKEKHNDFLQLLVDTADEGEEADKNHKQSALKEDMTQNANLPKELSNEIINKNRKRLSLTDNEIISQSWLFLLAGYETASTAIAFCFYELALNPDIQDKVYDEIQAAIDPNAQMDYDILSTLPYLDAVISESLRRYPPFCRVEREVKSDYQLADTGITLKAGDLVHISIYAVHHNEEYFPNAQKFIPERFLAENRHTI
ncbi:unnamed protein product, partial [Medioppia subpectinata]